MIVSDSGVASYGVAHPAFAGYVARISDTEEIGSVLSVPMDEVVRRFGGMAEERGDYRYAPGKWSTKEGNLDILDIYGRMLAGLERYDEALAVQRRAHEMDPLEHRLDWVTTLLRAGRDEEALEGALRVVDLEPHLAHGRATLGWAYLRLGRTEEGLAELQRAVSLAPGNTMFQAQLGQALGLSGDIPGARRILEELEVLSSRRYVSPYHLAYVYTGLGEHERAVDCLERAYDERAGALYSIRGSFLFRPLHGRPRFTALLAKMNLA